MNQIVSNLLVYGQLPEDSILWQLSDICEKLKNGSETKDSLRTRVFGQVKNLLTVATDYAFDKNLWHNYLTFLLITNENPFSLVCEKMGAQEGTVNCFVKHDFEVFMKLFDYDFSWIEEALSIDCFTHLTHYQAIRKKELMDLLDVENSYTLYMAAIKGNMAVLDKLEKVRGFVKTDEAEELAEDARIEFAQATEVVTSYSKMLKSIKETFESVINMDSNTNINRLTMWNIILVVPTVIVGYYGMNVRLPFAEYEQVANAILIFIMVLLLGFALFSVLRRRIS
jgi:Mg2+ and Co2+ transporter CorA